MTHDLDVIASDSLPGPCLWWKMLFLTDNMERQYAMLGCIPLEMDLINMKI